MEQENLKFSELNLSENIKRALSDIGYDTATPIQSKAIPEILKGRDLVGQSQTGTGKTASFGLPLIDMIDTTKSAVQSLILCPTRELAIQITEELRKFTKYSEGAKCLAVYGGEPIDKQIRGLKSGVKIVVGTPGRIMDHLRRKTLKTTDIKMVVLDEADEMLNMGFEEDIREILSKTPEERQTILFSATMNRKISAISEKYIKDPVKVKIKSKELTVDRIEQVMFEVKSALKDEITTRLIDLNNPKKAVVFCNTKKKVDNLIELMKKRGYKAEALHGDIKQEQRQRIMNRLKAGEFKILVATDVVARGIDVDELELVINYDIPQEAEYYVHRIGRTGRKGNYGKAYTFVVGKERNRIKDIEKYANTTIQKGKLPSMEEINKVRNEKFIEKVQTMIDSKKYEENKTNIEILKTLVEKNDINTIAAALLELVHKAKKEDKVEAQYDRHERVKLFLTVGKKDKVQSKDIVGSIASNTIVSGREIGKIKILDSYSFVEVPGEYVNEVMTNMKGKEIKGRKCDIEIANS